MQSLAEPGTILITEATHRPGLRTTSESEPLGLLAGQRTARARQRVSVVTGQAAVAQPNGDQRGARPHAARRPPARGRPVARHASHACAGGPRAKWWVLLGEAGRWASRACSSSFTRRSPRSSGGLAPPVTASHPRPNHTIEPLLQVLRLERSRSRTGDNPLQIQEEAAPGRSTSWKPTLEGGAALPGGAVRASRAPRPSCVIWSPSKKRQRILRGHLRALALAEGASTGLTFWWCENLHWIDQTSEDCLAMLVEGLAGYPILLVRRHIVPATRRAGRTRTSSPRCAGPSHPARRSRSWCRGWSGAGRYSPERFSGSSRTGRGATRSSSRR